MTDFQPLSLRRRVVTLCSLVAFLDGFDTQSVGPAGSAIAAQIGVKLSALGLVFSASQLGFLAGALMFGALGDRFGRKRMLVIATGIFAICTLGTAGVGTYSALLAWRLLTGFGLGGATPNFISLASEFSLPSQRSRVVTIMWAAVPFGGMAGSFVSAAIIPRFGWQAIFFIGCAAPLILVPVLMSGMPESAEIGRFRGGAENAAGGEKRAAVTRPSTVAELFTDGRARTTLLLWGVSFMTWMTLVVVAFWTPPLLQKAGMAARTAASVLAFNNAGGVIGTVLIGVILGWLRPEKVLIAAFIVSAMFIAAMGAFVGYFPGLVVAAVFAGFFSSAAGGGLIAVAAGAYPVDARATGVGWALGLGRLGSILGPLGASLLVAQGWQSSRIYFAVAGPTLFAAGLMGLLARELGSNKTSF